jgi:hypothetical protein
MNTAKLTSICTAFLLGAALTASSSEAPTNKNSPGSKANAEQRSARKSSPEFERMKTLVGTWKGKTDMGQGPVDLVLTFRLLAAGTVLEERCFAGTPNEMVTMYFDDKDGKLALTHYCMLGNRPAMSLTSVDAKSLSFELDGACGIHPTKESHMNGLTIRFDDANTITTSCKAVIEGKSTPENLTTLKRIKTNTASVN